MRVSVMVLPERSNGAVFFNEGVLMDVMEVGYLPLSGVLVLDVYNDHDDTTRVLLAVDPARIVGFQTEMVLSEYEDWRRDFIRGKTGIDNLIPTPLKPIWH